MQGVFFRRFIKENAEKLHLNGWVKNIGDHVEAVFEGKINNVHKMVLICKTGPKSANVEEMGFTDEPIKGETTFKILY